MIPESANSWVISFVRDGPLAWQILTLPSAVAQANLLQEKSKIGCIESIAIAFDIFNPNKYKIPRSTSM